MLELRSIVKTILEYVVSYTVDRVSSYVSYLTMDVPPDIRSTSLPWRYACTYYVLGYWLLISTRVIR